MNAIAASFALDPLAMTSAGPQRRSSAATDRSFADMVEGSQAERPEPPRKTQTRQREASPPDTDQAPPSQSEDKPVVENKEATPATGEEAGASRADASGEDRTVTEDQPGTEEGNLVAAVVDAAVSPTPAAQPTPATPVGPAIPASPGAETAPAEALAATATAKTGPDSLAAASSGDGVSEEMAAELLPAATARAKIQATVADKAQAVVSQPNTMLHAGNQVLTAMSAAPDGDGTGTQATGPLPQAQLAAAQLAATGDTAGAAKPQAENMKPLTPTVGATQTAPVATEGGGKQPEGNGPGQGFAQGDQVTATTAAKVGTQAETGRPAFDALLANDPQTPPPAPSATAPAAATGEVDLPQATTAMREAPLVRHLPSQAVLDQVAVHINKAVREGVDGIRIQLHPASLGHLEVNLEVGRDGRVVAQITADRQDTLDLLQRDARGLERALQDAGLKADAGSLNFGLRGEGRPGQEHTPSRGGRHGGVMAAHEADTVTPAAAAAASRAASAGGIDIRV